MKGRTRRADDSSSPVSAWIHRLAVLTAATTFFLIVMGGLVTSKGVGLVVPDWPTTFGQNPFLFPLSEMVGGIFYEHGHRLIGSIAGFFTLILSILLLVFEKRRWLRRLGVFALGLVMLQGVLGGLRVLFLDQTLAIVHASVAQAFFALSVCLALFTSKKWHAMSAVRQLQTAHLFRLSGLITVMIYLQIILGAILRHTGSALHMHFFVAMLVAVHVALFWTRSLSEQPGSGQAVSWARLLGGLLVGQLFLGVGSYAAKFGFMGIPISRWAMETLTVAHVATGGLMLAVSLAGTVSLFRLSPQAGFFRGLAPGRAS